jgi:hypothetical protein
MMRIACSTCLLIAIAFAGGCCPPETEVVEGGDRVMLSTLGAIGPTSASHAARPKRLGAGDAMGRALFAQYAAYVRAHGSDAVVHAAVELDAHPISEE